jgi:ParB family transcriptional regulator, chromosome partitioning protein
MTTTRTGRGSFAAMYEVSRQVSVEATRQVRVDQLEPNPFQPRSQFHKETLEELATSIRTYGLLQPIMVRPHPDGTPNRFQIVAGERRFQASKLAGLEMVTVVIKALDDRAAREVALIENLQRENISPLEEANALKQILDETGLTHRELGERIGKTKAYVEQRVRLLRYPVEVQAALAAAPDDAAAFTPGHAKAVVQLEDDGLRRGLIDLIETNGLSVREAERRVHQLRRVADNVPAPTRAQKLTQDILRPQGLSDAGLDAAIAPTEKVAKVAKAKGSVDLRSLQVHALIEAARATGAWDVDAAALKSALKADLAALN